MCNKTVLRVGLGEGEKVNAAKYRGVCETTSLLEVNLLSFNRDKLNVIIVIGYSSICIADLC